MFYGGARLSGSPCGAPVFGWRPCGVHKALNNKGNPEDSGERRLWRFAGCSFDEARRELKVGGEVAALEGKPLEIMLELLRHAGEVVTKDELLDAVWPGVNVVEGSLATAVSKLRKALGGGEQDIIVTVPRIGYRLVAAVELTQAAPGIRPSVMLAVGDGVPGREQWRLEEQLDHSDNGEVWLARHSKTHEARVFKFAHDGTALSYLKREATLLRLLRESLGERPDIARVLEWNFETPPFFLESEYGGPNLEMWARERGGLSNIALAARLTIIIDIARAVAAAHDVGVLHKDLKPANVLVTPKEGGGWQIKVVDFGSGRLLEPGRLEALRITNLAATQTTGVETDSRSGTPFYLAPETLAGHVPTVSGDIYALGIMLYQIVAGDFRKPLSAGWEADIGDPLLREDIALAAAGDPTKRLGSAAVLAERLSTLARRRAERDLLTRAEERARIAERKVEQTRARRPWVFASVAALAIGVGASLFLYARTLHERDTAERQTAIAESVNQFLSVDFLSRTSPFKSGQADESLVTAVKRAAPDIDRRFKNEPQVAARLYQAIAHALDRRSDWAGARKEYDHAAALFARAEGPAAPDTVIVWLQRVMMEARSYEAGTLDTAKKILAAQEKTIAGMKEVSPTLKVWLASARGMVALIDNRGSDAARYFGEAYQGSLALPAFDSNARLTFKQRLAFALFRTGDGAKAEQMFRQLAKDFALEEGAEGPNVLMTRLNVLQALMAQGKHDEVVREANLLYPEFVTKLGADQEMTLQLLSTRAQSEGALEMWDDNIRDELRLHEMAVAKQGAQSFFAIAALSDGALSQCRAGHYADGMRNAEEAHALSQKAFGDKAGLTQGVAFAVAACLIGTHQFDRAGALLDTIDANTVAQLAADAYWGANVDLARAQIAYAKKDFVAARALLNKCKPAFARPEAEAYQRRAYAELEKALDGTVAKN